MTLIICVLVVIFFLFYFFPILSVIGESMSPTYTNGEFLISKRVFNKRKIKVGDVVVYKLRERGERERTVIKRVVLIKEVKENHRKKIKFFCRGDNLVESYDSRHYGFIDESKVILMPFNQREKKEGNYE